MSEQLSLGGVQNIEIIVFSLQRKEKHLSKMLLFYWYSLRCYYMSIGLGIETETTEEIHRESSSLIENRTRLLLLKRDTPLQRVLDLERMMAEFDPNGS
jgi:hypothetical protein